MKRPTISLFLNSDSQVLIISKYAHVSPEKGEGRRRGMSRLREKTTATLLIAVFMISAFTIAMPVSASIDVVIDGDVGEWTDDYLWFTDNTGNSYFGGYPEFTYYKMNDEQDLFFAIIVNDPTPLEDPQDDMWLAFRLDEGDNYPVFRKGFKTDPSEYGQLSVTGAYGAYGPLPGGVEFGWSTDDDHIYYEWKIPLALLGVSPGDTIKYLTHIREYPKPDSIPRPINYRPDVTWWAPYPDINQFGDLKLWAPPLTISEAIEDIEQNIVHRGIENSLTSKLQNALKTLERGNTKAFVNILNAFINHVEDQSGKNIDADYAGSLIEWALAWIEDPGLAQ